MEKWWGRDAISGKIGTPRSSAEKGRRNGECLGGICHLSGQDPVMLAICLSAVVIILCQGFIYLFMRDRERGRDIGRERSRLPAVSPMQGSIPGPQDHDLGQRQTCNHWATGASHRDYFNESRHIRTIGRKSIFPGQIWSKQLKLPIFYTCFFTLQVLYYCLFIYIFLWNMQI